MFQPQIVRNTEVWMRSTKRNKIEIENKNKRRYEKLEEGGLEKEEGKKEEET